MGSIKVIHYALDEVEGDVILRGVIDPKSLADLKVDDYQREILPGSTIPNLVKAYGNGSVPDIVLGMRGHRVREMLEAGCIYLHDDVYVVDGQQRVEAAKQKMQQALTDGERMPRVGAAVHFGTSFTWERNLFRILNADRVKVSPNVLMYNARHDLEAVKVLYSMSQDRDFVLRNMICWRQRKARQELLTALSFAKVVGRLHSHLGPGRSNRVDDVANGLQRIYERVGKNVFRSNIRTFFDLVDKCWGVKRVSYKEGAVYMRTTFLEVLAMVLSDHLDFWRDDRLFIPAELVRKIQQFPVNDQHIDNLSSSTGKASHILYILMVDHINSGKRTRRLRPRKTRSFTGEADLQAAAMEVEDELTNGDQDSET